MCKIFKSLSLVLLALSAIGCQSIVRTDISTFRDEGAISALGTIRITSERLTETAEGNFVGQKHGSGDENISKDVKREAVDEADRKTTDKVDSDSLEFSYYKDKLASRLQSAGYTFTDADDSEYLARLSYGVIRQEKDEPSSRVVIGGHFGHYLHYPHSPVFLSDFDNPKFEYVRELSFGVERLGDSPAKIIQIKATSIGKCEHLTVVYDEMLEAVFSNLYRANGSVVKVSVKGDARCP